MNNKRLITGILFSALFVSTIFLAVYLKKHIVILSLLGLLFSVFAVVSILSPTKTIECSYKKRIITAIIVLSITLLLVFCAFLILYLLGRESLDWYSSVLGIIANASLLFCCCLI